MFFPQSILDAIRQNDSIALDIACDGEADDLFQPRPFVFCFNPPLDWDATALEILTRNTLIICNPAAKNVELLLSLDLLTLALHFAFENVAYMDIVDQLLLRGHALPRAVDMFADFRFNGSISYDVVQKISTFSRSAQTPKNANIISDRHTAIIKTLCSCRDTYLIPEVWDIIQSFLTNNYFVQKKNIKHKKKTMYVLT